MVAQPPPVQELFDQLSVILISHSMAAERLYAEVKQWEGSKVTHICNASRNAIANRYLRKRDLQIDALQVYTRDLHRSV